MRIRAAGLIIKNDELLLVKHVKGKNSYWLLPGGGIKLGEDTRTALKREIKEEINLDCTIKELIFVVESVSLFSDHIVQPTYSVEVRSFDSLKVGIDKRVTGFHFFDYKNIENKIIYPDIKHELQEYLKNRKSGKKYIYKKWIK